MRSLPPDFAARLGDATTLCHCWRLLLRDGTRLGFTDHDRDIMFDGLTHQAHSGFSAGEVESNLGFAIGGTELAGAFSDLSISEAALAAGRFDGATMETWLVDWRGPDARLLLEVGQIGEVRRSDHAFTVEVRSLAHLFDEPVGRIYQASCAADFGDARCGLDLNRPQFRFEGTVLATDGRLMIEIAATSHEDGWFANGTLRFSSGANLGAPVRVREHRRSGAHDVLGLWAPLAAPAAVGDGVVLTAGCDKSFATCRGRFANVANFRGFPHMPGNDVVLAYANAGDVTMDGGSLFR
jgi:uncharacterized phage protein (TIGR02218 family)